MTQYDVTFTICSYLGLVVCRGTQVSLICPSDGMEEIANPFEAVEEEEDVEA